MNDLTKEELIEIEDLVQWSILDYGQQSAKTIVMYLPLLDKIKSLIDNFCEHEYYLQGAGAGCYAQCHKCGDIAR